MKYTQFRKKIRSIGFYQVQHSVYAKLIDYYDKRDTLNQLLKKVCPQEGHVRLFYLTSQQYDKGLVLVGEETEMEKDLFNGQVVLEL